MFQSHRFSLGRVRAAIYRGPRLCMAYLWFGHRSVCFDLGKLLAIAPGTPYTGVGRWLW